MAGSTWSGTRLGGIVGALYAAAFPERIRNLVMIDSLGALSRPVKETIPQLRKAVKKRIAGSGRQVVYPDIATAAKAREGGLSPLTPRGRADAHSAQYETRGRGLRLADRPKVTAPVSIR